MKYYLIAGEASGDLYGGLLMQQLKQKDPSAEFKFWGGPEMKKESSGQLKSIKETSFMGFWEVAKNARKIKTFFDFAKYSIKEFNPDLIIFIDYPGFNLRMTTWAKDRGYKTAFYISPQLWAWKENRHKILRDKVDLFFVILPFERDFYRNLDTPCTYVGHPLLEVINEQDEKEIPETIKTIGLFPGSRKQEIQNHLPILIDFAVRLKEYNFIIAGMSHIKKEFYLEHIDQYAAHVDIEYDNTYGVMKKVDFAVSSSGTATLELALHMVPQMVIYKTSNLSFMIGKRLVKTDYISLVNLIATREVVPELLQHAFNPLALDEFLKQNGTLEARTATIDAYKKIKAELGEGKSSELVATKIVEYLKEKA